MKKSLLRKITTRLAGSAAVMLLAVGVLGGSQALAGISTTKHNLGTGGTLGNNKFDGTGEICVFCHTPHGADASASVPLWNRVLNGTPATTYTTYNSLGTSSLDGATAPVGSVSIACLSCHDGTQAMNVMINKPGSGGYNVGGDPLAGNWTGGNQTSGKINTVAMLDVDLKNDHPIGIEYGGGYSAGAYPASAVADGGFKDVDFNGALHQSLNGTSVWWVETGGNTTREKTDMMLYTRTGADSISQTGTVTSGALTGARAFVECASCHDPHTDATTTFLRIDNTGSAVCLACHIK